MFREPILIFFKKNKYIFEKKPVYTIVSSEITFSKNLYHIETSQLIALQIN